MLPIIKKTKKKKNKNTFLLEFGRRFWNIDFENGSKQFGPVSERGFFYVSFSFFLWECGALFPLAFLVIDFLPVGRGGFEGAMFLWQLSEDWLLLDYKGLGFGCCQVWNLCFRYRCVPIAVLPKRLVSYHYVSFWNHNYGRNVRACWYSSSVLLPLGVANGDRVRGEFCCIRWAPLVGSSRFHLSGLWLFRILYLSSLVCFFLRR